MKDIFDPIRAILNRKAVTADQLADGVVIATELHEAAKLKAGRERLQHPKHVLASASQAATHKALLRELDSQVMAAAVVLEEAERRHAEAAAAESEAAKVAKYDVAAKLQAEVGEELAVKYPELATGLLHLLHRVTYADDAIRAANDDLPEGRRPLDRVEALVRDAQDLPRKNLRDRVVSLWAYPDGDVPLPDEMQARVSSNNNSSGHILPRPNDRNPSGQPVVKKRFRRIDYVEAVHGHSGDRLSDMKIPALRGRDPNLWNPGEAHNFSHVYTLRRLNEVLQGDRVWKDADRPVKVEYIVAEDSADIGAD